VSRLGAGLSGFPRSEPSVFPIESKSKDDNRRYPKKRGVKNRNWINGYFGSRPRLRQAYDEHHNDENHNEDQRKQAREDTFHKNHDAPTLARAL